MRHSPAQRAALAGGVAKGWVAVAPLPGTGHAAPAALGAGASPDVPRAQVVVLPAHTVREVHAPARVRALSGTLWLTVDGLDEDIVLEAGEGRRFAPGGRVLAHALGGEAVYEVCASPRAATRGPLGPVRGLLSGLAGRLRRRRSVPEAGA